MVKKILFPLASVFLVFQSYKLISTVQKIDINSIGLLFLAAWLINLFITGIFAFTGFAYPTQKLMPSSYYHINNPDGLRKTYNFLQVGVFRKFLLATLWKNKSQRKKYFNGKRSGIEGLLVQSQKAEFGHLLPFIIISFLSLYFLFSNGLVLALFTQFWNIIGNLYPIILQRHHRMRIQRLVL